MKKYFLIVLFTTSLFAQNFSNGFNFNLPWNDSTTQKFLPRFPIEKIPDGKFVTTDGSGNFIYNGKPIRFWGGNCVASGAFPAKNIAASIAGRMRKMGINLIRFHHIDNDWGGPSLLTGVDTRTLDPNYLDLMEYFISKMKENGIFINMNLNVSRMFKAFDGVDFADSVKNYGTDFFKVITYFDPLLIQLQKEYAQQLLTHVNPYTGKALINDPVMAMLETNNENSLYRAWRDNILKPIKNGGKLIYKHSSLLDSLWNGFLLSKYQSTENLKKVWNIGTIANGQSEQIINGGFEKNNLRTNWALEEHNGADADTSRDNTVFYKGSYSVKIVVKTATGTEWHIQFKQPTLALAKDSSYTVSFAAKADASHQINVSTMNDQSPYNGYGGKNFLITSNWQIFSFSFKASETNNGHARITFQLAKEKGTFWFDEISVAKAGISGLLDGESIEQKNIKRIEFADCVEYSDNRVKDISEFYINLQQNYFKDMFAYLRSLGVKVPIVGTNWNVGAADLAAINVGDYVDNHAYWDHPSFPNIPWSSTDWLISNKPMVKADPNSGTMPALFAGVQMSNKPYTISEYNHPFPNQYQAEAVNFILGYAGFNGADGIMFFDYGSSSSWNEDKIDSYFSINRNPIFMAQFPSAAFAFRNGLIGESVNPKNINYTKEKIYLYPKNDISDWSGTVFYNRKNTLVNSIRTESFNSNFNSDLTSLQTAPASPYITDNNAISWDTDLGVLYVNGTYYQSVTGYFNNLANKKVGSIYFYPTDQEYFGSLSWLTLDKDYSLLTLVSKIQNTNMVWSGTTTINNNWGSKPTQIFPLKLKLDMLIYADSIRVYPLDIYGKENESSAKTYKPFAINHFMITLDQTVDRTLWFGIRRYGEIIMPGVNDKEDVPFTFELKQNYPNPFNPETTISYQIPNSCKVTLKIFNLLGKEIAVLVDEYKVAGKYIYNWNTSNKNLASGMYFYKLTAGDFVQTRKMILLK